MKKSTAFYKLTRPFNALTGALAVILGGYVAANGNWGNVAIACAVTVLITASSNAWNDCLDVEIDKVNRPDRVLPAGHLTVTEAWAFSVFLAALSVLLAAFISWPAFLIALFSNLALYIYSWRLKSTVLIGNATVALVSAASLVFGGLAAGNPEPAYMLSLIVFFVIFSREILKTMADYEGDLSQQVKTVATVWGRKPAGILFVSLLTFTCVLLMLPYLMQDFRLIYVIITAIGIYPVLGYVATQVRASTPATRLEQLSQLIKYDFLVWFVAVIVGGAA